MSINKMKVWMKCPSCGYTFEANDYHENESSDRCECLIVLSLQQTGMIARGKTSIENGVFTCGECGSKTNIDTMFRCGCCSVENKDWYKSLFASALKTLSEGRQVFFSDWDADFRGEPSTTEQPALDRLCAMYPDDNDFARLKELFRGVRSFGRDYINKLEFVGHTVARNHVRWAPALRKVYLHSGVERIDAGTFQDCTSLWDVFLPDSIKEIGDDAFLNSRIKTIHTSANLVRIGKRAFKDCKSLTKIFFPDHLVEIGECCFENCAALEVVYLPDGVALGQNAFLGCTGLKKAELPHALQEQGAAFFGLNEAVQIIWR